MAAYTSIDDPGLYFNGALYSGTASGAKTFTGMGFQPDFIMFKQRNATRSWVQIDSVRGVTKAIQSDSDAAEHTNANYLASFDSDGFTTGATQDNGTNDGTSSNYVAQSFKAGTTSGLSGGTITPTAYSINTDVGFGVYAYTGNNTAGATIAHGLGLPIGCVIIKQLTDASTDWVFWQRTMAVNEYLYFNSTATAATDTAFMNSVLPSTTLITLGDKANVNGASKAFVMYVWAQKQGYFEAGEYVGNNNAADGTFCYTGFRPSLVIAKNKEQASSGPWSWQCWNNNRIGYNGENNELYPNTTASESGENYMNFLSNGFKLATANAGANDANDDFVYCAWAEQPFVNSNGVPANAYFQGPA
jgi:hypothetical protein